MKRCISMVLAVVLLFAFVCAGSPTVYAAQREPVKRAIAIVFDNSGSMYSGGEVAWCRATYAMEVFASMLNEGDTLFVYPMSPIMVQGKEYTMEDPFRLTDASQAHLIREIYTDHAGTTPIESIDCAVEGMKSVKADKKYVIVLTDGDKFWQNRSEMSLSSTKRELDARFSEYAGKDLTVMYLGIGRGVAEPATPESEFFAKEIAGDSAVTLAALTKLCNKVFGRNSLPADHINGNNIEFGISMSKLIVFVQGENVSNVKLTPVDNAGGRLLTQTTTRYSTAGCGNNTSIPDETLQGMMVTYTDCAPGNYTLSYSGTATSVDVYYEPDAELDFVFTDLKGNEVPAEQLYAGEYKVSFGIKDAKTGKLISSDLLGEPQYRGAYYISGKKGDNIEHDGQSGEKKVTLKTGDVFDATLTVTYLNGYTETKTAEDFGWPKGGLPVVEKAAGELKLEISGGDKKYLLPELTEGSPYIAKVFYRDQQMTGEELEAVDLKWDPSTSNAEIKQEFAGDHYKLWLNYKNPAAPAETACGECTVDIHAFYTEPGCNQATAQDSLTYRIEDKDAPLKMDLYTQEDYIVISELGESRPLVAELWLNGKPMTPEELASVKLQVNTGGIAYKAVASAGDSAYHIQLQPTPGIAEGDYKIDVTAQYADPIGRVTEDKDTAKVTLGNTPLWIKWAIRLLALALATLLLVLILRIKVLPKHVGASKKQCTMYFDGEDVTNATTFTLALSKGQLKAQSRYAGKTVGVAMTVSPGDESYLYKPSAKRSAKTRPDSVKKFGPAKILDAMIGSAKYTADENGKLVPAIPNQKPFTLTHGQTIRYSGTMSDAGVDKDFEVKMTLNYKKK